MKIKILKDKMYGMKKLERKREKGMILSTAHNSGYAVCLRSPKPLRASHTRETLG